MVLEMCWWIVRFFFPSSKQNLGTKGLRCITMGLRWGISHLCLKISKGKLTLGNGEMGSWTGIHFEKIFKKKKRKLCSAQGWAFFFFLLFSPPKCILFVLSPCSKESWATQVALVGTKRKLWSIIKTLKHLYTWVKTFPCLYHVFHKGCVKEC